MPLYAALIYSEEGEATPEEWAATMAEYNEFGEKAGAAGVITGGEALQDSTTATTVHVRGGKGGRSDPDRWPVRRDERSLGRLLLVQMR